MNSAIPAERLEPGTPSSYHECFKKLARVNEILWRVDERLRPDLEQKGHRKINEAILNETARILLEREQGNMKHTGRVFWQTLVYEAQYGRNPTTWEIEKITEVIQRFQSSPEPKDRLEELSLDKSITISCEKSFSGHEIPKKKAIKKWFRYRTNCISKRNSCNQLRRNLMISRKISLNHWNGI